VHRSQEGIGRSGSSGPEEEKQNNPTWVEVMIPSKSPLANWVYELLNVLVHTVVPWGHPDNWRVNHTYATITLLCYTITPWAGLFGILIACMGKWLGPRLIWGDGDNWTVAWYVFLVQLFTEGGLTSPLKQLLILVKNWFSSGTPPAAPVSIDLYAELDEIE
jgi:hypothetical protein